MGLEQIRCTIVIWDESQHVSLKRLENVKNEFDEFYYNVFPEGRSVKNVLVASESEYFKKKPITKFLHEGKFISYEGKNKDLAIMKYAACGLIDQNEAFRSAVDDIRDRVSREEEIDIGANNQILITFITSDWAEGMEKAINWVMKAQNKRNHFGAFQIPQKYASNKDRIKYSAEKLGIEIRQRVSRYKPGLLEIQL